MYFDLQIDIQESAEITYITLSGRLNENNNLPAIMKTKPIVVINSRRIHSFNSIGLSDWEDWICNIKAKVYLVECGVSLMEQINTKKAVLGNATIASVMVPLSCPQCESDEETLFDSGLNTKPEEITKACKECGTQMEVSILESLYFNFLSYNRHAKLPDDIQLAIQNFQSGRKG